MKIRLKFYSYSAQLVQSSLDQMAQIASQTAQVSKVCLPTKRKIFCVLRSPHVNKDSREHFEIRIHRRLLELKNASAADRKSVV